MSDLATQSSTVIPGMRYRDALGAITWLEQALGFKRRAVFMSSETTVAHAELTFGTGMIMLGSVENNSAISKCMAQPDEIGSRETRSISLVAADCRSLYRTADAAGAEMVAELREMEYGGWAFTCRDPEGHLWSVGEYNPWAN